MNNQSPLMTESRFRGMYKMHMRAERAYRALGNVQQAECAKRVREQLVATYPQYEIPSDTSLPTAAQIAASLGVQS